MSKNERNENVKKAVTVADMVEAFDMSYHMGKALEDMLRIEIADSRAEAEVLAKAAKSYIDRYVAFQWKGM